MKNSASWLTWIIVAGLLIFAGIASAVVPLIIDDIQTAGDEVAQTDSGPAITNIEVSELPFIGNVLVEIGFIQENIQGRQITLLQAFGIAFGAVLVGVGALAVPLAGVTLLYSRQLNKVYSDPSYEEAVTELQRRENEFVKEMAEVQPPSPEADLQKRSRGSTLVLGFIILVLVWISALVVSVSVLAGRTWQIFGLEISASAFSAIIVLITAIILALVFRKLNPTELEQPESEYKPVNWGTIWVIVTGFIVVGIGAGIAIYFSTPG